MSIFHKLREHFTDVLYIFRKELLQVVKDEGVLMFLVVVPLGYPLLYSWIYNNESMHETPVVVVDQSHTALSRQFINDCDASAVSWCVASTSYLPTSLTVSIVASRRM